MISLVTQSDGSARRFPFVTFLLVAAVVATFARMRDDMAAAQTEADAAMAEAVAYFEEHPHVVLPDAMQPFIAADHARALREAEDEERDRLGMSPLPERVVKRIQGRFDALVAVAFARLDDLPANAFGVRGLDAGVARLFEHALYHATLPSFALGLAGLLLLGIALEDAWGSLVFATFCALAVPAGALLFATFHSALPAPWLGTSGLVAALLGASLTRWMRSGSPRLLGAFPLQPLLLAPAWLAAEYVWVRQLGPHSLGAAPAVAHGALLAGGLALAFVIRKAGFEEKLTDRWDDAKDPVRNPTYEKAMDLRTAGKRDEAMEILLGAFGRKATEDVALGLWDVSKELGRPGDGAGAALWLVRDAVRRAETESAIRYWGELVEMVDVVDAEPPLFLRMADLLARDGRDAGALDALERALRAPRPLPAALALRAAGFAAERDAGLAARIAARASEQPDCSPRDREKLAAYAHAGTASAAPRAGDGDAGAFGPGDADAHEPERRTPGGEPLVVVTRPLPGFKGLVAKAPSGAAPAAPAPAASAGPEVDAFANLDPGALDLEGLDDATAPAASDGAGEDVESWNSPGMLAGLADGDGDAAIATPAERAALFGSVDDEPLAAPLEEQLAATPPMAIGEAVVAADEPSSLPAQAAAPSAPPAPDRPTRPIFDAPSPLAGAEDELAFEDAAPPPPRRALRQIAAVPLALEPTAIKVDAEGKGKTRLPYDRVDAVAVAAVRGLGPKPVVVIDLVLGWRGDPREALRVVRLRSDRFDPRAFVDGTESGLAALRGFVAAIAEGSGGEALPSAASVRGEPFATFDSLDAYHRDVLGCEGDAG